MSVRYISYLQSRSHNTAHIYHHTPFDRRPRNERSEDLQNCGKLYEPDLNLEDWTRKQIPGSLLGNRASSALYVCVIPEIMSITFEFLYSGSAAAAKTHQVETPEAIAACLLLNLLFYYHPPIPLVEDGPQPPQTTIASLMRPRLSSG